MDIRTAQGETMANVTLALDDGILHKARIKAVHEHTSVNAVVREFLTAWVRDDEDREALVAQARQALEAAEYRSGGAGWTRDEIHER
jgi:plasmid stability protein